MKTVLKLRSTVTIGEKNAFSSLHVIQYDNRNYVYSIVSLYFSFRL